MTRMSASPPQRPAAGTGGPTEQAATDTAPATSSTTGTAAQPFLRVRLINIDHVCSAPGPFDRTACAFLPPHEELRKVPVLRIFGATPNGQRVCLHLHGIFPYCYIPYHGELKPDIVLLYISRLGREINAAITASLGGNPLAPESNQHLAAIHLVKGVPFYGFHVGWSYFLKISFVDPSHSFRLATILQSGRVMRTIFQPYEIHIRYQLQFMLDYNIFGCDYIDLETAHFRLPLPSSADSPLYSSSMHSALSRWDDASIPRHLIQSHEARRASFCDIEIDASAKHVLNRRRIRGRNIHHNFDADDLLQANEKLVPSLTGLWEEEATRRKKAGLAPTPSAPDPYNDVRTVKEGESPSWSGEARFRQLLEARLALDSRSRHPKRTQDFTKTHPLDPHISTTFESVNLFHYTPEELASVLCNKHTTKDVNTQVPSTLFDLEHNGAQATQQTYNMSNEDAPLGSSIDAEFFSTQAFQRDIEELERQNAPIYDSDKDSDFADTPPQAAEADVANPAPNTPQKAHKSVTSNPTTPKKSQNPSRRAVPTSLLRPALETPKKTLPGQVSTARFLSPLRNMGSQILDDAGDILEKNSSPTSACMSPPSQGSQNAHIPLGSPQWLAAHIKAQMLWRESACLQHQANQKCGDRKAGSADGVYSTVPVLAQLDQAFGTSRSTLTSVSLIGSQPGRGERLFAYAVPAPSRIEVIASMQLFGLSPVEYQEPYYSDPYDVPAHSREYAGRSWRFGSKTIKYLPDFPSFVDPASRLPKDSKGAPLHGAESTTPLWEYAKPPPQRAQIHQWLKSEQNRHRGAARRLAAKQKKLAGGVSEGQSHYSGPTQGGSFGFKISQRQLGQNRGIDGREKQHMTIFSMEIHANSRGNLMPDPKVDPVQFIAYSFQHEEESLCDTGSRPGLRTGLIILDDSPQPIRLDRMALSHLPVVIVSAELDMFNALVDVVRELDPEILIGYEIHNGSWGYVIERARHHLGYELVPELGRVNNRSTGTARGKADNWGWTQTSALKITGRHILNIWRLIRGELNLNQYTYENVVFHLLRSRVPRFPHDQLTQWYASRRPHHVVRVLKYWIERVETDLLILETSEIVFRTAEFARIYGIDFSSVISRGSQFKVESVLFRIAKPESFLLPSPNAKQVAEQNAAECLPLIMEPQSAFYQGPLLVLDFQSLYPSVMIAYNVCYSTCLGRVAKFQGTDKFGTTELSLPQGLLTLLSQDINISANGLIYVKPHVRKSLLAKMLTEILDTRVMVKGSVKGRKNDKAFVRTQNARQLSLKLLANVTYGYTSATFSGRMPCVEIADSIVQYGRETLEKAIELVHATSRWGAQVVYGDTDSLFIYLPGRSKDDAFRIGKEIADAVTAVNPKPVKLKFEKVYLPSLLLAKKRYVGLKYESPDDKVPEFNAKGIETVRRDGFPALQRMLEACIRILFTTQDLSLVKSYCQKQWRDILSANVSVHDFVIAKEVRLGKYSENGVPPPGAAVSRRRILLDARAEPQHAERVPYLITFGEPKAKLNDLTVEPGTMLANPLFQLNATYYITRGIIPPLQRVFNVLGADVEQWYREMPRASNLNQHDNEFDVKIATDNAVGQSPSKKMSLRSLTLTGHYRRNVCLSCSRALPAQGPTPSVAAAASAAGGIGVKGQAHDGDKFARSGSGGGPVCVDCLGSPAQTLFAVTAAHTTTSRRLDAVEQVCAHCSRMDRGDGGTLMPAEARWSSAAGSTASNSSVGLGMSSGAGSPCINWDCPVLYERQRIRAAEFRQHNRLARVQIAIEQHSPDGAELGDDTLPAL